MKELSTRVGQLFIVGFGGETPPPELLEFMVEEQIGGVILFDSSCATQERARETIRAIRSRYAGTQAPFVAIDQEGGRVCRLKGAPAEYRAPQYYAEHGEIERFAEDYRRAAVFMESLGINLNLAPTADIFLEPFNECLKHRCFGDTADSVVPFVRKAVQVSRRARLLCCLKHFPGLGAARIDPHEEVATVGFDSVVWRQREMLPFAAGIEAGADLVMTTHVVAEGLDEVIATGSPTVVTGLLRTELSFDGPIVTDDLTMKGASSLGSIGERAVAALKAGHDILLFGQDYEAAIRAYDYVQAALGRGEIDADLLRASLSRVAGVKFKLDRTTVP